MAGCGQFGLRSPGGTTPFRELASCGTGCTKMPAKHVAPLKGSLDCFDAEMLTVCINWGIGDGFSTPPFSTNFSLTVQVTRAISVSYTELERLVDILELADINYGAIVFPYCFG
ncbi:hypothetical protein ANO14919_131170 [Xylariales sp. No.14919]|nr:hypothetical protein ANO14919_131170 [Xylariales sp. No.14919]